MCANYRPASRDELSAFPLPPPDFPYAEAYPGSIVPIVSNFAPREWVPACFGLVPGWAKDARIVRSTYNARAETVGEKPSFRDAWRHGQLCIIPASEIYEPCYESGKAVRWRIARADGKPMGIAGIWVQREEAGELPKWSMSMLTINADNDPVMQRFHKPEDEKRSVVILPDDLWGNWLRAKSEQDAREMLRLYPADALSVEASPR
ncbi:MAG: SOS response-associated peptidase [Azoarcus sp.]|jgi:putative SOS response-associated peptidase YedK|nr:SOS response-associated peptidase [Azoarcus sp.]